MNKMIFCLIILISSELYSLENSSWSFIKIQYERLNDLDFSYEFQKRASLNELSYKSIFNEFQLTYSYFKYLELSLLYRNTIDIDDNSLEYLNRLSPYITLEKKLFDLKFSTRLLYQYEFETGISSEKYFRNKYYVSKKINKDLKISFASEIFILILEKYYLERIRFTIDTEIDIIKDLDLSITYHFQKEIFDQSDLDQNIFKIGFVYEFD